jgi:hypothetical protein
MRLFSAIVLAGSFVAMPAGHAADKAAWPTEVNGVKLSSICNICAVVSEVRKETVDHKGSSNGATDDGAPASGAVAGNESGKKAKTATLWTTTVILKGGTTQTYKQSRNPGLHPGDVVILQGGVPRKYVK